MSHTSLVDAARDVAHRVASGAPAGDWTAPETTLAMLISVYGDPSKLGGTKPLADKTRRQHPAVVAVAHAIGRTQDAVVMKVMNLRSTLTKGARGLPHAAKLERTTVDRQDGRKCPLA